LRIVHCPLITVHNISFTYPDSTFRLEIESLSIDRGQKAALIGSSGIGKTTLLNLTAGILLPQTGKIEVDGSVVNHLDDAARRAYRIREIGFVFQDFRLLEYLDVLDNILLPYRINRALTMSGEIREKARSVASDLGIQDKLNKQPARLSHGERQRVAICRALLTEPKILLADEPTGNLDPANKAHILEKLFDYVDSRGATLVTVTHDHALLGGFNRVIDFGEGL
jgi:putative ABC transport system ATP-binding protein